MESIQPQFIITVTGPKGSGKTTWLRTFVADYMLDLFPRIIVMSPTIELNEDFEFLKHQDKSEYFFEGDPENFENILQQAIDLQFEEVTTRHSKNLLVILDDCATEDICRDRSVLDAFAIRHRHYKISFIIVGHKFQGTCGLPRSLRSQINRNIIFNPASMSEPEILLKEALLSDHVKEAKKKALEVFSTKYNYIVFTPSEVYNRRLLVNFETPLLEYTATAPMEMKKRESRKRAKKDDE